MIHMESISKDGLHIQRPCEDGLSGSYAERNALTIFKRAARTAGRKPPANPIKSEKRSDVNAIEGDNANENCSSENDW